MRLEQVGTAARAMFGWCLVGSLMAGGCDRGDEVGKEENLPLPPAPAQPGEAGARAEPAVGSREGAAIEPPASTPTTTSGASEPPSAATKPAAPPIPAFRPLADAVEGEWVLLSALGSRQLRYDVARVGAGTVTLDVTIYDQSKKPLGLAATREEPRNLDLLDEQARAVKAVRSASRTTIEAAGRAWETVVYEDRWTDEGIHYKRRTWVSPEAPVFGTIRMELYGDDALEARLELTALGTEASKRGRGGDSERGR